MSPNKPQTVACNKQNPLVQYLTSLTRLIILYAVWVNGFYNTFALPWFNRTTCYSTYK